MTRKKPLILVLTAIFTRSEEHPLAPLLKVMRGTKDIKVDVLDLTDVHDREARIAMMDFSLRNNRPDIVLCGFDRPEMVDLAYCAYHMNIPVAQIFAGDISGGAFDDADRFVISTYSTLIFCADNPQYERIQRTFMWRGLLRDRPKVFIVGATHFDDMDYDEPEVAYDRKYALILYNPPNKGEVVEQVYADLNEINAKLTRYFERGIIEKAYWIAPNGDYGSDIVVGYARGLMKPGKFRVEYLGEMKRKKFLGLLKHAFVMIGNSSSMSYEAAFFKVDTQQIGERNKYREKISVIRRERGASLKIINHIRDYFEGWEN